MYTQGRVQNFSLGAKTEGLKNRGRGPRAAVGFLGRAASPSHQLGDLEERSELPAASGNSTDHPKVFHYFQHLGLPLLLCGLSRSHWGSQDPRGPSPCVRHCVRSAMLRAPLHSQLRGRSRACRGAASERKRLFLETF